MVADAGMLSAGNLKDLHEAGLRFIVGSRATKAPAGLASHFRWHGDAFTDGQIIDTITAYQIETMLQGVVQRGTAAAAASVFTVMRTSSEPARASSATCKAVPR